MAFCHIHMYNYPETFNGQYGENIHTFAINSTVAERNGYVFSLFETITFIWLFNGTVNYLVDG